MVSLCSPVRLLVQQSCEFLCHITLGKQDYLSDRIYTTPFAAFSGKERETLWESQKATLAAMEAAEAGP